MDYEGGHTALVLPVPDAESIVGHWRERFDPSAACGMPAHITILVPFLALGRVGSDELESLRRLFADAEALPLQFAAFGSFPQVLYLQPKPAAPLVELTLSVVRRWPETPPYAGAFAEVVPHLTVAVGIDDTVAEQIRAKVGSKLPLRTVLCEAWLLAFVAGRWSPVQTFPLGRPPASA